MKALVFVSVSVLVDEQAISTSQSEDEKNDIKKLHLALLKENDNICLNLKLSNSRDFNSITNILQGMAKKESTALGRNVLRATS